MKLKKYEKGKFLTFIFILFSIVNYAQNPKNNAKIYGNLELDSIWRRTIYISYISSFDRMNTMSKEIIIAEAPIDMSGNFSFDISYFSPEDKLYRLHITKENGPIASLIIGGSEENHFFIIANNTSNIFITNSVSKSPFGQLKIIGYQPNNQLKKVDEIFNHFDSTNSNYSVLKRELITRAIEEELRFVADTSSHPLISLYALQKSNFENNYKINQGFYKSYIKKWKGNNSTYFKAFKAKLPPSTNNNIFLYILIGSSFFTLGLFFNKYFNSSLKANSELTLLTNQERKIFSLIQKGKSNKEISEEYHIGLSTVKSHVSSIYSKLNIKSRREAINIKTQKFHQELHE